MTELEYCRLMLDNHIGGLEISKAALPEMWEDEDEEKLILMRRIREILRNIREVNEGE